MALILLVSVITWMGCAGPSSSPFQERAGTAYERRQNLEFRYDDSNYWNSTDWSLYTDMQGGG